MWKLYSYILMIYFPSLRYTFEYYKYLFLIYYVDYKNFKTDYRVNFYYFLSIKLIHDY